MRIDSAIGQGLSCCGKGIQKCEGLLDHRGFEAMIGIAVVAECDMFMVKGKNHSAQPELEASA